MAENLNKHTIPKKTSQYNVTDQLECDVWFDTVQVWEGASLVAIYAGILCTSVTHPELGYRPKVKAADLSKSSAHRGAVGQTGEEGRGIGLRFPRFERVREDKGPCNATTSQQILDM